jgi:hypothetical protein
MWSLRSAMNGFVTIITKENQNQTPKLSKPRIPQNQNWPKKPRPKLPKTQKFWCWYMLINNVNGGKQVKPSSTQCFQGDLNGPLWTSYVTNGTRLSYSYFPTIWKTVQFVWGIAGWLPINLMIYVGRLYSSDVPWVIISTDVFISASTPCFIWKYFKCTYFTELK